MKEKYEDKGFWLPVVVMVGAGIMVGVTAGTKAEIVWGGIRVATRIMEERCLRDGDVARVMVEEMGHYHPAGSSRLACVDGRLKKTVKREKTVALLQISLEKIEEINYFCRIGGLL